MDNYALLNKYKSARLYLMVSLIFSAINVVLMLFKPGSSFVYSLFVPMMGMIFKDSLVAYGYSEALIVITSVFLPMLLLAIAYTLSKKDWHWLLAATILFGIDTFLMMSFWVVIMAMDGSMMLEMLFEIVIFVNLIFGVIAGKKLNNDFSEVKSTAEKIIEDKKEVYIFDKELYKSNKISKFPVMVIGLLIYVTIVIGATMIAMKLPANSEVVSSLLIVFIIACFVLFCIMLIKILPYTGARNFAYYIDEQGNLCRILWTPAESSQVLKETKIVKETEKEYFITYNNEAGKTKKLTIPKCYQGLDEVMQAKFKN